MDDTTFAFDFDPAYQWAAWVFGVRPSTAQVTVSGERLNARFGPWKLTTVLSNIHTTTRTGPYSFVKTAGPAHLSLADRGMTMATNGRAGLCIEFLEPVPGIDPTGRVRHPALTVTVADIAGLERALAP